MRFVFALVAVAVCVGVSGCGGTINVNGVDVPANRWEDTMDELRPRAALELDCQGAELEFVLISVWRRHPREIAVQGCGRRAIYERPIEGAGMDATLKSWTISGAVITLEPSTTTDFSVTDAPGDPSATPAAP
jgi:hypothetical protein